MMLRNPYLIAGVCFGVVAIAGLFLAKQQAWRSKDVALPDGVVSFLTAGAIPQGIQVCVVALDPGMPETIVAIGQYVFLGGLAVIWVSVSSLVEVYRAPA